jgi:hypothetical protein
MSRHLDLLTGKYVETSPKKRAPEQAVGTAVDAFLHALGGYVRQINSAGTMRNGKWTRSGQGAGISDRLCWLPSGKFIAVELKAPGKKRTVSDAQYAFLHGIISRGHVGCVADSIEDVKRALSQTQFELSETLEKLKTVSSRPRPKLPELWE